MYETINEYCLHYLFDRLRAKAPLECMRYATCTIFLVDKTLIENVMVCLGWNNKK
jgi:hypothetical protein